MRRPAGAALFGLKFVHLGLNGYCLICRASLTAAAAWPCDDCGGWVESAPPWAILSAVEAPELKQVAA